MISSLPEQVIKYMINKLPPYTGIHIIRTDSEGIIKDWYGHYDEYLEQEPQKGQEITENVHVLIGMIPPLITPMILQKIKTTKDKYADIHIIDDNEGSYWIFFVDRSKEAESIRVLQQKINETWLGFEQKKSVYQSDNPFGQLHIFDYVTFKKETDDLYSLLGETPLWFKEVAPELINKKQVFLLAEKFPFIEVFAIEAKEFWETGKEKKKKSGIWIEQTNSGKEFQLNAFAVNYQDNNYLLIKSLTDEFDKERDLIQQAREQSLAYDQLAKAEKKLKELLEYKDKFVSIVSHDLRSPVASVLGIAEMLINDQSFIDNLDDFNKEMILSIKDEMIRLLDYNDKLYHWSNLELGNFDVVKSKVNVLNMVKTARRVADKKMKSKGIKFCYDVPENLEIEVDKSLFLQVLNNLVGNAVKFTPEKGTISIEANSEQNNTIIKVSDTGVGMPKEVQEKLFRGFSRGSTLGTRGEKGTGLGMGIVQKIIEAHGFNISVDSEPGKGTSFIIRIQKINLVPVLPIQL